MQIWTTFGEHTECVDIRFEHGRLRVIPSLFIDMGFSTVCEHCYAPLRSVAYPNFYRIYFVYLIVY